MPVAFYSQRSRPPQQRVVAFLDPRSSDEWDTDTATFPHASFFHGTTWSRILADTYGFLPAYLKANHSTVPSLLPIMEVNSPITGRRGVSLPFTDECNPLAADDDSFTTLFRAALNQLTARKWRYLEFRGEYSVLAGAPAVARFFGHEIKLNGRDTGAVYANCSGSARGAVKKAEKSGVQIEICRGPEDMEAFYSLLCQTRKRHGNPPQPIRFFREIHRHAIERDAGLLLLAKHQGELVAGAIFLHSDRCAIYKYAASDIKYRHLSANNLVFWHALEWYVNRRYDRMQLGRTSLDNDGLRRFKRGWGAREYSINYFRYSSDQRDFVPGADKSSGWQTRIFRLLPAGISRCVGAIAYKHIA